MSMNAHHCCIVFSNDEETAMKKLNEIAAEKTLVKKYINWRGASFIFEDEEWVWVKPIETARGFRAHKAFVDIDCTIRQLEYLIKPICELYCEEFQYFGYD